MLIPSIYKETVSQTPSLSRRVNANSQHMRGFDVSNCKLIKKGEC